MPYFDGQFFNAPTTPRAYLNCSRKRKRELDADALNPQKRQILIDTLRRKNIILTRNEEASRIASQLINNSPRSTLQQKKSLLAAIDNTTFHPDHEVGMARLAKDLRNIINNNQQPHDIPPLIF